MRLFSITVSSFLSFFLIAIQVAPVEGAATTTDVFDGQLACTDTGTVQFCEGGLANRVETWDGVPLDVNVTLPPASMDGPFPLIIQLHGWSLGKDGRVFEERALNGYVVLDYTARGFHESCGKETARLPDATLTNPNVCEERGWTHLGDVRYEGRDSQFLAGLLVDEGIVDPNKIAATGGSYGGGRSMMLAVLKNRVMLPDGTFIPWESPEGVPMQMAAAAPLIPWSDLARSLVPNGGSLDYLADNPYGLRGGVQKETWNALLFGVGQGNGYYAPIGVDPSADLFGWNERLLAGEPYDADETMLAVVDEVTNFHSAYYMVDPAVEPAPMFVYNAWTDDLFPANEGVRIWRKVTQLHPNAEVALHFADAFGHFRAGTGTGTERVTERLNEFFDFHLKGIGSPIPPIEVYTQDCGGSPEVGPKTADDWDGFHRGDVVFLFNDPSSFNEDADPSVGEAVGPVGGEGSCRTIPVLDDPAAATYYGDVVSDPGYTMLGAPTVIADLRVVGGEFAQVAARLWDVDTEGNQHFITHSVYRPRKDNAGPQVFQLAPNGWVFAAGHRPKLELVGMNSPSFRASNGRFEVVVNSLELRLPVEENPDGSVISEPAELVLPVVEPDAPGCPFEPLAECREARPGKSKLSIFAGRNPELRRLTFKWKEGAVTSVDDIEPALADGGYTVCVYDGSDTLVSGLHAPTAVDCGDGDCWTVDGQQLEYRDEFRERSSLARLRLRAGAIGESLVKVNAKGPELIVPELPLDPGVAAVQVVNGDGGCWGTEFSVAKRNDRRKFRARTE